MAPDPAIWPIDHQTLGSSPLGPSGPIIQAGSIYAGAVPGEDIPEKSDFLDSRGKIEF